MHKDKQHQQFLAARVSIIGAIILFLVTATVGIMVDSIALILDASSSLIILIAAFLMNFSIKKIHQPPDRLFNFGYHKYEPLTAAVQSGLIIATCLVSIKFAIQDIVHAESVHSYGLPVIATFLCGIAGIFVTIYLKRVAVQTNSQMIKTTFDHWLIDTALSFGVCAGFAFGFAAETLGYHQITPYVDPVMAIILALLFIFTPVKTGMHSLLELLDIVPGENISGKVRAVVDAYRPKSFGVHRLRTRKAGEKIFVDVCFLVNDNLTVRHIEELAQGFERDLKVHLPDCDTVVYFKPKKV